MENISIRHYTNEDYATVYSWWEASGMPIPPATAIPEDTSFIVEIDGEAAVAISAILTNIKAYCYIDFLVGNPNLKGESRRRATKAAFDCVEAVAKTNGYLGILCFTVNDKLASYYDSLGYKTTCKHVISMFREIE